MNKLAHLVHLAIRRWTSKSPKAYRLITDVSLGIGIAATALPLLPITIPVWTVSAGAFLLALSAKMTISDTNKYD